MVDRTTGGDQSDGDGDADLTAGRANPSTDDVTSTNEPVGSLEFDMGSADWVDAILAEATKTAGIELDAGAEDSAVGAEDSAGGVAVEADDGAGNDSAVGAEDSAGGVAVEADGGAGNDSAGGVAVEADGGAGNDSAGGVAVEADDGASSDVGVDLEDVAERDRSEPAELGFKPWIEPEGRSEPELQVEASAPKSTPDRKRSIGLQTVLSGCILVVGVVLLVLVLLDRGGSDAETPSVEEIFEPNVVDQGQVQLVQQCTDSGFIGALTSEHSETIEVRLTVDFVTSAGVQLHQSQLSGVTLQPGERREVELPLVARLIDSDLLGSAFVCQPEVEVLKNP